MADEQQVCPNCGSFNRAGARFCSKCGHVFKPSAVAPSPATPAPAPATAPKPSAAPVPSAAVILCPNCGKEVSSDTRFCRHCGHPLGAAQPTAAPAATVAPAAPSPAAPNLQAATGDDDVTQPLGVKTASPQLAAPTNAAPTNAAPRSAPGVERGAPAWLWALVGLLSGILIGAGIVLAAPGFVGLERIAAPAVTPDAAATDALTPAVTDAATPLDLSTATTEVVPTATSEPSPTAVATATPTAAPVEDAASPTAAADVAPPDEAEAPPADAPAEATEAVATPADVAAPETLPTSTPLAP